MFLPMKGVPKFRGNEEVLTGTDAGRDGGGDTGAYLSFIAIIAGTVEVAIALTDCLFYNIGCDTFGCFPGAKSDEGHLGGWVANGHGWELRLGHCDVAEGFARGSEVERAIETGRKRKIEGRLWEESAERWRHMK